MLLTKVPGFTLGRLLALLLLFFTLCHDLSGDHLPEGYYVLLHWVVCPVLALCAYYFFFSRKFPAVWVYGHPYSNL